MKKKLGVLAVLLFSFTSTAQAIPQTITFASNGSSFFTTSSENVLYRQHSSDPYYINTGYNNVEEAANTDWVAFNPYSKSPSSFASSSGEFFNLESFWIAGAWGSQTLTITGYAEGQVIQTISFGVSTEAQEYLFSGFEGLDTFDIAIGNDYVKDPLLRGDGQQWALGSVTISPFDDNDPAGVPEPGTLVLLVAGLGIVGTVTRRRLI